MAILTALSEGSKITKHGISSNDISEEEPKLLAKTVAKMKKIYKIGNMLNSRQLSRLRNLPKYISYWYR